MLIIRPTSRFKRDVKRLQSQNKNLNLLEKVVLKSAMGEQLGKEYRDHDLKGEYFDFRECHIKPDWLLIYKINGQALVLTLARTGSHSELFKKM